MVSISDTNPGPPPGPGTQHFVQVTQQHPSQPGYPAQDFQTHLQQQLYGNVQRVPSPQVADPHAEQAKQQLQDHIAWFEQTYGVQSATTPNQALPTTPTFTITQPVMHQMQMTPNHHQAMSQIITGMPQTPVMHPQAHTVPNTPQNHVQCWPSPPMTNAKHARSQSFQLDVAPMPVDPNSLPILKTESMGWDQRASFVQDSFNMGSDNGYASSAYSSSVADVMSPHPHHTPHMPTLFEEDTTPLGHHGLAQDAILLQATAGAMHDTQEDDFFIHAPQPLSPRQAALAGLGDINASIEDTGIRPEDVEQYMSEQDPKDSKWTCLFHEDGKTCGKRFGRKENIRAHIQTHLGDRQFKCNDCGKCFVRQHDLKRHAKIHSGQKPHVCPCGQGFARHDALTRHRQRGMCEGVLPGFEKSEEEKSQKKRGRPKKERRPDFDSRRDKASRARRMDSANAAAEAAYNSGSSDSGASDHSFPVTPPDSSDINEADFNFNDFTNGEAFSSESWQFDTPPTSPLYASPTKTMEVSDFSSPSFGAEQTVAPDVLSSHGSPSDGSDHSSPVDFTDNGELDFGNFTDPGASDALFHGMLDSWIQSH